MQQLRQTKTLCNPEFHNKRSNTFALIEIVILCGVNEIESGDPANYAYRKHDRGKIDSSSLRYPCTNWRNSQRETEEEVRRAREPFRKRIEENQCQSNRCEKQS